jgi:hypothetical protein
VASTHHQEQERHAGLLVLWGEVLQSIDGAECDLSRTLRTDR